MIDCGKLLRRNGYRIKIFNTINFKKSMHYKSSADLDDYDYGDEDDDAMDEPEDGEDE